MNPSEQQLWRKINDFALDDPDSQFSFTDRLARENLWPTEYAIRAVFEYKRFIFLTCVSEHPLTPSDQVDQVWHLHLIYTESYWIDFCEKTIGRNIVHGPTKGGSGEREKFINWYEETKKLYMSKFKQPPPADIWPPNSVRFKEINFARVNLHRNWVIPKLKFFGKWKF